MKGLKNAGMGLAVLLAAGVSACAPQQQAAPPVAATTVPGDHQAMMAHCAEMRQQMRQGAQMSPDMQRMATYCQHMDHTMGAQRGRSGPY